MFRLKAMTFSASTLFRATALALTAGLSLAACSSTDEPPESNGQTHELDTPEAPEATEQETALAETLEEDFDADSALTMEEQWPDIYAMASALAGTEDPDLCQQAGAAQYDLLIDTQPANVRATIADDALLDEQASGETVTVFYANDDVTPQELQEAHENTDTACVEEYESAIDHDTTQDTVGDHDVEVHTWQVIASEQLTGRMIDVVSDELFIRYAAAYPPQLAEDDLPDDAATEFNDQATERALAVFEAAAAQ